MARAGGSLPGNVGNHDSSKEREHVSAMELTVGDGMGKVNQFP